MEIAEIPTPALVLDRARLVRNLRTMQDRMDRLGVRLRPHLKTAKSVAVARLAGDLGAAGITVSTLREAAYFADQGIRDILYAVGIVPARLPDVGALSARGADIAVVTDQATVAREIAAFAEAQAAQISVLIEIDSGGRRAGVLPEGPELLEIAGILGAAPGVTLRGVLTHAGHSYHARSVAEVREVAAQERDAVVAAAGRLRQAGHACPVVSAGSTPTATHATDLSGVTEMRPGVYMFQDLDQCALGSCRPEDVALTVAAAVIGHTRHAGQLILDSGALALSKDVSATEFLPEVGYGQVCDAATAAPIPGLTVAGAQQEHGIVPVAGTGDFDRFPVGSMVRIMPNHACMTAAAHDRYWVVDGGAVVDRWERINGW